MTTQAPAEQRVDRRPSEERVRAVFRRERKLLAALFPKDGDTLVARACAVACTLIRTKALCNADPDMLAEKVIAAHHLGLEIGDQASIAPFGEDSSGGAKALQLIIGPRGLIALAYRSGFVKSIVARSVFEADYWEYDLGDQPYIRHRKADQGRRQGVITHAYCVIETTTEGKIREVLTREDIEYYRSFSKARKGPWFDNFEGMCRKTVIKRTCEFVPRSALLAAALRENEVGGYEIPEEMWEDAKRRSSGEAVEPITMTLGAEDAREPGEEG